MEPSEMVELTKKSPLASMTSAIEDAAFPGVCLEILPFLAQVGFRVAPAAQARVESTLAAELPKPNHLCQSRWGDIVWLGPDEWLVVGPDGTEHELEASLRLATGADGAVFGLSGSRVGLLLTGALARDVLATCCALDFHPRSFVPGQCAATMIEKAAVLIQQRDAGPTYRILVRPSFAMYVVKWLIEGMNAVKVESR
jgi:sarcosine oxidase subunit gamma